jgi:hypothetical protein
MSLDADQLFALLPAVYRTRDAENGGQLQALFGVLASQAAIVEDNIQQLYDDQFIETCAPWVVPYIGDLLGYDSVYDVAGASVSGRAEVANTIGYRRRKGTQAALEQVCSDISGRAAVVVEEFRNLITTASMRHVEPSHVATVDLRNGRALWSLGTAFDAENYTIDVRRIAPRVRDAVRPDPAPLDIALHGPGRFNIPDLAIHLWRWQSWQVTGPAFVVGGGRYRFSSLGTDMPLFTDPPSLSEFTSLTSSDVIRPIGRCELLDFYGTAVELVADGVPVPASQIYAANLADRAGGSWCTVPSGQIAVDPELGRIQYASDVALPQALDVSYSYGFPAPIGGGGAGYDRTASIAQLAPPDPPFFAIVGTANYPTIEQAVSAWNQQGPGSAGIIVVPGYESLSIDLTGAGAIQLPAGSTLAIAAGAPDPAGGPRDVTWNDARPTLTGNIEITGAPGTADDAAPGALVVSGLWVAGQLTAAGEAIAIDVADCTFVPGVELLPDGAPLSPGEPSITISAYGSTLVVNRGIVGPILADPSGTTRICNSIVDATSPMYVAYADTDLASAGADLQVEGSTIVGKVHTRTIALASNTIFNAQLSAADPWTAAVWASRRQAGCVRFCWLPVGSITPSCYNCLPPSGATSDNGLAPSFVTLRYGDPAYALLSGDCPLAIWNGSDTGSQIGAYLQSQETEAVANVQLRAPEYLPALLESGVFIHPSRPQLALPAQAPMYYAFGTQPQGEQPVAAGIGAELV